MDSLSSLMGMLSSPAVLACLFALIIAVAGGVVYWWLRGNRAEKQQVLLVTARGSLRDKEYPVQENYVLDNDKRLPKGWFLVPQARKWAQGRTRTKLICDERSAIPYCFGTGLDRPAAVEWGKGAIKLVARERHEAALQQLPSDEQQDKVFGLLKTVALALVFIALLVTCVNVGVDKFMSCDIDTIMLAVGG